MRLLPIMLLLLAIVVLCGTASAAYTTQNITSYYNWTTDAGTTVEDISGAENDGVNVGTTLLNGGGLYWRYFNGTSSSVITIPQQPNATGDYSFEFIFKSYNLSGYHGIFGQQFGVNGVHTYGTTLTFQQKAGSVVNATTPLVNNTMYHVVVTYTTSGTIGSVYINGALEKTGVVSAALTRAQLGMGSATDGTTTGYLDGCVYYFRAYNMALSAGDVLNNYYNSQWRMGGPALTESFTYKKLHNITAANGTAAANYPVKIVLYNTTGTDGGANCYLGDHVQSDWDDIRFNLSASGVDQNVSLAYWREPTNDTATSTTVWVNMTTIATDGTTGVYVRYGNPAAGSAANGFYTFPLFDDFSAMDLSRWTLVGNTPVPSASNGMLNVSTTGSVVRAYSKATYGYGVAMRSRVRTAHYNTSAVAEVHGLVEMSDANRYGFEWYPSDTTPSNTGKVGNRNMAGTWSVYIYGNWQAATWLNADTIRNSTCGIYKINDSLVYATSTRYYNGSDMTVFFTAFSATAEIDADWIFVRPYSDAEPTHGAWGAEETSSAPLVANFSSNVTIGVVPFAVKFFDNSTGSPTSYNWTFGDVPGAHSHSTNPVHVYTVPGLYTVTLTVENADGSDYLERVAYINATGIAPPAASFTANVTSGYAPLGVQFTDTSSGWPTSWNWSFGDGSPNATTQNAVHVFDVGTYDITLTVSNENGTTSTQRVAYIVATARDAPMVYLDAGAYTAVYTTGNVTITVLRANGQNASEWTNYSTQDLTAIAGIDYTAASGQIVWADGEASREIVIAINNSSAGAGKQFIFRLDSTSSPIVWGSPRTATITIVGSAAISGETETVVYILWGALVVCTVVYFLFINYDPKWALAAAMAAFFIAMYLNGVYIAGYTKFIAYGAGTELVTNPELANYLEYIYIAAAGATLIALFAAANFHKTRL